MRLHEERDLSLPLHPGRLSLVLKIQRLSKRYRLETALSLSFVSLQLNFFFFVRRARISKNLLDFANDVERSGKELFDEGVFNFECEKGRNQPWIPGE